MGFFSRSTPEERREKAEKKVAKKMSTNQPLVRTDIGPLRNIRDAIKMYAGFGGLNENKTYHGILCAQKNPIISGIL